MENQEKQLVDIKRLVKISNYALKIQKSRSCVNRLIEDKKIDLIEIDGVKFIYEKE